MGIIESWGSGIPRLFELAKEYNLPEPLLESVYLSFRVNLFRKQSPIDSPTAKQTAKDEPNLAVAEGLTPGEQKILTLITNDPTITYVQMAENSNVSVSTVKRILNTLKDKDYIQRQGGTRGRWLVLK